MAYAFDLIASEYGWSDKRILDLTLRRFRWTIEAIEDRLKIERRERARLFEAHAKAIASGFQVMVDKKGSGKFRKFVDSIQFWNEPDPGEDETGLNAKAGTFRGRPLPPGPELIATANRKRR